MCKSDDLWLYLPPTLYILNEGANPYERPSDNVEVLPLFYDQASHIKIEENIDAKCSPLFMWFYIRPHIGESETCPQASQMLMRDHVSTALHRVSSKHSEYIKPRKDRMRKSLKDTIWEQLCLHILISVLLWKLSHRYL